MGFPSYREHEAGLRAARVKIEELGLFASCEGPSGAMPTQLFGTLVTGEYVYFRARHNVCKMEISEDSRNQSRLLARYVVQYWDAGWIEGDKVCELIKTWLDRYYSGDLGFKDSNRVLDI
jgi:hypothetical protein